MTYLDCSVTGCFYNEERCCCKGNIEVKGKEAKEQEETCCGSFKERENGCGCGCNATTENRKEIDVSCQATKCVFNQNLKCAADHIGIAGGNACDREQTRCASFECCTA